MVPLIVFRSQESRRAADSPFVDTVTSPVDMAALDDAAARIAHDLGIPPCPAILTQLLREMRAEATDFTRIAGLVAGDVALSATMLRTVNSPFYGLRNPAISVQQALGFLGLRTVAQLATGLLLRQAFPVARHERMEDFWERSATLAAASARVARHLRCIDHDVAHTFGLFRDCGAAIMMGRIKGYATAAFSLPESGGARITDFEAQHFGTDHAKVGYHLARTWFLTEDLCNAVLHHHSPDAQRGRRSDLDPGAMRLIAVAALAEAACVRATGETPTDAVSLGATLAALQLRLNVDAVGVLDDLVAENLTTQTA